MTAPLRRGAIVTAALVEDEDDVVVLDGRFVALMRETLVVLGPDETMRPSDAVETVPLTLEPAPAVEETEVVVGVGASETRVPLALNLVAQSTRPMPFGQHHVLPASSWVQ
jgi:hypothetical protein